MGLFHKRAKEETPSFRRSMAEGIARHRLRVVTERVDGVELVIGRAGGFNIRGDELLVSADNRVVFRCLIPEAELSELMSLEGAVITAPDLEQGGKRRTLIAYYVYYR